jgi:flagellar biogenesis protein FliO
MKPRTIAGALALGVSLLTASASATPLDVRHDGTPPPPAQPSHVGLELMGFAAALGGAAFWLHKRRRNGVKNVVNAQARIVSRTSIAVRSELLVVDIGEQRLLLGVTPSSIRHIADLEPAQEEARATDVGPRFQALVDSALRDEPKPARDSVLKQSGERPVEAQAASLLALRRR